MKYNPKMNIRHFEREIADRFKSKYEDNVLLDYYYTYCLHIKFRSLVVQWICS